MGAESKTNSRETFDCAMGAMYLALDEEGDELVKLEWLRSALAGLTGEVERTVGKAREAGATWQDVADAVGMNSRQAAQIRYGA